MEGRFAADFSQYDRMDVDILELELFEVTRECVGVRKQRFDRDDLSSLAYGVCQGDRVASDVRASIKHDISLAEILAVNALDDRLEGLAAPADQLVLGDVEFGRRSPEHAAELPASLFASSVPKHGYCISQTFYIFIERK